MVEHFSCSDPDRGMTRASNHVLCYWVLGNYIQFVFITRDGISTSVLYVFTVQFPHVCHMYFLALHSLQKI